MEKVKIKVVKLGKQRHDELFNRLKKYKSDLFTVDIFEKSMPDCDYEWGYTFETLEKLLIEDFDNHRYDMCIGFVDTIIEYNYFGKRLGNHYNTYVVSFFQVDDLLKAENNDVFNFMTATIYRYVTRFNLHGECLTHDETRGCLFDMCGNKRDIVFSCDKPIICESCRVKMREKGIESEYIQTLTNEIMKIHKPNYYRISGFVKKHPYLSLAIGLLATIFSNIVSSGLYDWIKTFLCLK